MEKSPDLRLGLFKFITFSSLLLDRSEIQRTMQVIFGSRGAMMANPQEEERSRYCSCFFLWDIESPILRKDVNITKCTNSNDPDSSDLDSLIAEQKFLSQMRRHRQKTLFAILLLAFLIVGIALFTDTIVAEIRKYHEMEELPDSTVHPKSKNATQSLCSVQLIELHGIDACIDQCEKLLCCSEGICTNTDMDCKDFRFCFGHLPEIILIPPTFKYDDEFSDFSDDRNELHMKVPTIASIFAGSLGGAIGVLASFPFDTLKTLAQSSLYDDAEVPLNLLETSRMILQKAGWRGFYGGVRPMMIGQAFIKALAFGANAFALNFFATYVPNMLAGWVLVFSAAFSGFLTGFFVTPVERIKIMMQSSSQYKNEFHCIRSVMRCEGLFGLFGRGLGPTMWREIPGYAIYFAVYGLLMETAAAKVLGYAAPCLFGAIAGCLSWLPVYPFDVIKTLVQNTEGGANQNTSWWTITKKVYKEGGVLAFFDGLTPKMIRAAIYNAATFLTYDLVIRGLGSMFGFSSPALITTLSSA